jgi:CRISPR-associated protein Cmr3
MSKTINIQAADVLFFRDGRPFTMGEDAYAGGVFPPPPSAFYGALRSAFIGEKFIHDTKDGIKQSASLAVKHIFLTIEGQMYLPMPNDLVVPERKTESKLLGFEKKPLYSNSLTNHVLYFKEEGKTEDTPFLIELNTLNSYLNGESKTYAVKKLSDYMVREFKLGIGRDNQTNSTEDGKLYRVGQNRPANIVGEKEKAKLVRLGFSINFENLDFSTDKGFLALGGERRAAFFEKVDEAALPISCPKLDSQRFKIYIATTAVFQEGWQPENLLKKYGLTLLTAAVERAQPIGGWDLENQRPKPMLQGVGAGSVYYVEAKDVDTANEIAKEIHGKAISDTINGTNYAQQGFGIAYIGKI